MLQNSEAVRYRTDLMRSLPSSYRLQANFCDVYVSWEGLSRAFPSRNPKVL
jgi:hypothetical protein